MATISHLPPAPRAGAASAREATAGRRPESPVRYTAGAAGPSAADLLDGYRRMLMGERANSLTRRIREAAEGLSYPSETDAPVEPFQMKGYDKEALGGADLLAYLGLSEDTPVRETGLDEFLQPVVEVQDWYGPEERDQAARFRALGELLRGSLSDVRVFRVGERSVDVYVVGRTRSGAYRGVKTRVVET